MLLTGKSNSGTTGGPPVETFYVSTPQPLPPVFNQALFGAALRTPARVPNQPAQRSTVGEESRSVSAPPFTLLKADLIWVPLRRLILNDVLSSECVTSPVCCTMHNNKEVIR